MPNWCENELRIWGPGPLLDELQAMVKGEEQDQIFDFKKVIPYPSEFELLDAEADEVYNRLEAMTETEQSAYVEKHGLSQDGYNHGGHEWCVSHWGTKWNACEAEIVRYKKSLLIRFDTAWSPPHPIIEALARRFQSLRFAHSYYEGGVGFQGRSVYQEGELASEWMADYRGRRGG